MVEKLLLTLSSGRSGTAKLADILSHIPEMYAEHESDPPFKQMRKRNLTDRKSGKEFVDLVFDKWQSQNRKYVAHTCPDATDGFIHHFLEKTIPDFIVLRRPMREVALSMFKLNWIPGFNSKFSGLYAAPDEPYVLLNFHDWKKANHYQLCYWWCLESEARIQTYIPLVQTAGSKVWQTTLNEILTLNGINQMLSYFELPLLNSIAIDKVNHYESLLNTLQFKKIIPPDDQLDLWEKEIYERTNFARYQS